MKDIEIEIKVKVSDSAGLRKFLAEQAEFRGEQHQIDEYFNPPHKDFLADEPVAEWLRLRTTDSKQSINYKQWHAGDDGVTNHCDEYETTVEDASKVRKIFAALGFKPLVTVDKLRKNWRYQNYEVSMDSVKNLGDFVEIEYVGGAVDLDPKQITDEMVEWLCGLGCGQVERDFRGYPYWLLFGNKPRAEARDGR